MKLSTIRIRDLILGSPTALNYNNSLAIAQNDHTIMYTATRVGLI